jgi:hypothetical protein
VAKKQYRLVADFGYGDKTWVERFLDEQEAIAALSKETGREFESIEQALDYDYTNHYIERDHPDDEEDWDWMDS